jgi:hypothetical protein
MAIPAAKTKAKAKAKAPKKGRPSRDSHKLLRLGLSDCKKAPPTDVKFFGKEWKNVARNWQNYLADVNTDMEDASEEDFTQLQELWFQGTAVRKVGYLCLLSFLDAALPPTPALEGGAPPPQNTCLHDSLMARRRWAI